jgi:acyl-CoA reductase-like NAD-dependent aldehyde dehydrogenase
MANATDYGLANAVFSADAARCARVSNGLQSGVVWQNCSQVVPSATPFSGLIV